MLSPDQRIIVEAVRRSKSIEIHLLDWDERHTIRVSQDSEFAHDIAIAVQAHMNRKSKK